LQAVEKPGAESSRLLETWARLHAVRTVLGVLAIAAYLLSLSLGS
jgi:hypothetical protein